MTLPASDIPGTDNTALFRAQAAARLTYRRHTGNERHLYRELDRQSSRLAVSLRKQGIQPDDVIGLLADRSIETVTGMLAILKAGGAYLPIDPTISRRINT